jgi:hypothetical protein
MRISDISAGDQGVDSGHGRPGGSTGSVVLYSPDPPNCHCLTKEGQGQLLILWTPGFTERFKDGARGLRTGGNSLQTVTCTPGGRGREESRVLGHKLRADTVHFS